MNPNEGYLQNLAQGNCIAPSKVINLGGSGISRPGPTGPTGPTGSAGGSFVALIDSPDGITLTALTIGSLGTLTYLWGVKSKFIGGTDISFTPAVPVTQVATINDAPASYDGTVVVLVTDTFGSLVRYATAYWHTRKNAAP